MVRKKTTQMCKGLNSGKNSECMVARDGPNGKLELIQCQHEHCKMQNSGMYLIILSMEKMLYASSDMVGCSGITYFEG